MGRYYEEFVRRLRSGNCLDHRRGFHHKLEREILLSDNRSVSEPTQLVGIKFWYDLYGSVDRRQTIYLRDAVLYDHSQRPAHQTGKRDKRAFRRRKRDQSQSTTSFYNGRPGGPKLYLEGGSRPRHPRRVWILQHHWAGTTKKLIKQFTVTMKEPVRDGAILPTELSDLRWSWHLC